MTVAGETATLEQRVFGKITTKHSGGGGGGAVNGRLSAVRHQWGDKRHEYKTSFGNLKDLRVDEG